MGENQLTRLISGARLKEAVREQSFIVGGDESSVENVKYDFHMGDSVLKASLGQPMLLAEMAPEKRFVDPGEAVFVLTKERLNLPNNVMATLTPKRKLAHGGIICLGGFAVDPLYKGVILVGLYNFSSTRFPLQSGKKLIGALFYEIDQQSVDENAPIPPELSDFPDELIALINNYQPVELNGLSDRVQDLSKEIHNLRSEITTDKKWKEEFKEGLDKHNNQLGEIIKGLEEEKQARLAEDQRIKDKVDSMSNQFFAMGLVKKAIATIIILILGVLVAQFLPKFLG